MIATRGTLLPWHLDCPFDELVEHWSKLKQVYPLRKRHRSSRMPSASTVLDRFIGWHRRGRRRLYLARGSDVIALGPSCSPFSQRALALGCKAASSGQHTRCWKDERAGGARWRGRATPGRRCDCGGTREGEKFKKKKEDGRLLPSRATFYRLLSAATGKVRRREPMPDMTALGQLPYAPRRDPRDRPAARLVAACRAACKPCQTSLAEKIRTEHRPTLAALAGAVSSAPMPFSRPPPSRGRRWPGRRTPGRRGVLLTLRCPGDPAVVVSVDLRTCHEG